MKTDLTFISIPATGSRSIHLALGDRKRNNHLAVSKLPAEDRAKEMFAVLREPKDRLVSWWAGHGQRGGGIPLYKIAFRDWVMKGCPHHWAEGQFGVANPLHQHQFIEEEGKVVVQHLLRFEHLAPEFHKLTGLELRRVGASRRAPWEEYFTPEMNRLVEDMFAKDFRLHSSLTT